MTMKTLSARPYQREAIDAVHRDLQEFNRVAIVLPTGAGKGVVFSHLIKETLETSPEGSRVLLLVHREELIDQAVQKLRSIAPGVDVGVVKAAQNEVSADVVVASVQTLARESRREQIKNVALVVVDECHHVSARTWTEVLEHYGCFDGTPCVGLTATMYRADGAGLGNVWQKISYERDIVWAIERGYLTDVRAKQVTVEGFDLAQIAKSRGDYQEGRLGDALEQIGAGEVIAEAYREHAFVDGKPRRGILFAPTVSSAAAFADNLNAAGIKTETVFGTTPREDRQLTYKKFENGDIDVISGVSVLTEGFDAPWAEVLVMARPTQNPGLWTQAVGRVLRPFPGKTEALVLDVVGIAGRHGLQSLTTLTKVEVRDGESLAEAQERAVTEQADRTQRERIVGERASREVELFKSSHSVWLQTRGGIWFIPVRIEGKAGTVVLFQTDTGWSVGVKQQGRGGEWLYKGMDFDAALSWGEETASEIDPTVADKNRAWRRAKPSDKQLDLAIRLKLAPTEELVGFKRGALSDALSVHFASKDLDRMMGKV